METAAPLTKKIHPKVKGRFEKEGLKQDFLIQDFKRHKTMDSYILRLQTPLRASSTEITNIRIKAGLLKWKI